MKDEFLCNNKWSRGVGGIKRIYCRITIIGTGDCKSIQPMFGATITVIVICGGYHYV